MAVVEQEHRDRAEKLLSGLEAWRPDIISVAPSQSAAADIAAVAQALADAEQRGAESAKAEAQPAGAEQLARRIVCRALDIDPEQPSEAIEEIFAPHNTRGEFAIEEARAATHPPEPMRCQKYVGCELPSEHRGPCHVSGYTTRVDAMVKAEAQPAGTGWVALEGDELVRQLTRALRLADARYPDVGGSTRHYVRECLVHELEAAGLKVVAIPPPPAQEPSE